MKKETFTEETKKKKRPLVLVFAFISLFLCAIAFSSGKVLSGIIALIMSALSIVSWLMGKNIIPEKMKGLKTIAILAAVILIIPYFSLYSVQGADGDRVKEIDWNSLTLSDVLPDPNVKYGEIFGNSEDFLSIRFYNVKNGHFDEYIEKCKEYGYTVDSIGTSNTYMADNENGYSLSVMISNGEMSVLLNKKVEDTNAPENNTEELPEPPKTEEVKEPEPETEPEPEESEPEEPEHIDGMRPEFKQAMDDYEEFYDEYIKFMKEYTENSMPITMLIDYNNLVKKELEVIESFEAWEDEEMNDAESKYFLEVQTRVNKKLMELALQ